MAKHSKYPRNSGLELFPPTEEVIGVDISKELSDNQSNVNRVALISQFPARIRRVGLISGESYEWPDAGSTVMVLSEDVESLLALRIGEGACCGGSPDSNFLFRRL